MQAHPAWAARIRRAAMRRRRAPCGHGQGAFWKLRGRFRAFTVINGVQIDQNAHHRLAGEAPERYVCRAELAAIMAVSLATVDRMVAEGMPSVTWGRRTRRFRPSIAIGWAADRGNTA
jgi:hypothetical protein